MGEALKAKYGTSLIDKPESEWLAEIRDFATEAMMAMIREGIGRCRGVEITFVLREKALYGTGRIEAAIDPLYSSAGLIYRGTLEPPKRQAARGMEARCEQTLFRSTAHGDDVDRPIQKSDGAWTYFLRPTSPITGTRSTAVPTS